MNDKTIEQLRAVLCTPDGPCCIEGSETDRQIIEEALMMIESENANLRAELADMTAMRDAWRICSTNFEDCVKCDWPGQECPLVTAHALTEPAPKPEDKEE